VQLKPLAAWCNAEYIEKRVKAIHGSKKVIETEDGSSIPFDYLAVNVGSRTRGTYSMKGIEYSLTTRPINELLPKIRAKEAILKQKKVIPKVAVCGGGAAGVELAFAFKTRWTNYFGQEIHVDIVTPDS